MKHIFARLLLIFTTAILAFQIAGCTTAPKELDALAVLQSLLEQVKYDAKLSKVEDIGSLYFPDLPEGTDIQLYIGSGYYADEVALITLPDASKSDAALKIVQKHIAELRNQFANYAPTELGKIDNAVTYQEGRYIFLCITNDYANANLLLSNAHNPAYKIPANNLQTKPTESETTNPTTATQPEQKDPLVDSYPVLTSKSGKYHSYGNGAIRVDNSAFEEYSYVESSANQYASIINSVATELAGKTTVYCWAIPTSIGITLPDDIAAILPGNSNQGQAIDTIYEKLDSGVVTVDCFDNLMKHRDEYIYFRTDHHWNGLGAYYAYEVFCQAKGVHAYTLDQRKEVTFSNFLGAFYSQNSGKDPLLAETPDTVFAYHPVSTGASMRYTDRSGNTYNWNIITDVSNWNTSSKYSAFAAGDNPIAVFNNPAVTDGSVCIVVKESYGNALMPYLVDHYSTIYEIDYRYWNGNIVDFATEKNADDLIFANNLSMIRSNYLIGLLAGITD